MKEYILFDVRETCKKLNIEIDKLKIDEVRSELLKILPDLGGITYTPRMNSLYVEIIETDEEVQKTNLLESNLKKIGKRK